MLKISTGKIDRAVKTVVYGSEGIGKSTFASRFPDPLFIDTEGGTAQMDVRRVEKLQTWEELITIVNEVAATPDICKTLVIDRQSWWNAHPELVNRKAVYEFTCAYCGKRFSAYGNAHRKYCCHDCYIEGRYGRRDAR